MKAKLIHQGTQRTFAVILETGDEAVGCLTRFAQEQRIGAAQLTGLGAFSGVVLGFFDWQTKQYRRIPCAEQLEVLSLLGDVALGPDGKPVLHPHIVCGKSDGSAVGGHLLEGHVRPTLEVILTESPAHLRRRKDPESGLALIDPELR
jgi:predicted DNA-binding protein with PD1-like motif